MNILCYFRDKRRAKRTGSIQQEVDSRDYRYVSGGTQIHDVDLRNTQSPVRDQDKAESCVGFAVAGLIENQLIKYYGIDLFRRVSPMYSWYLAKLKHGYPNENRGVWLRYALSELYDKGFVYEFVFPHVKPYTQNPSKYVEEVGEVATFYLEKTAYYLMEPIEVIDCLMSSTPVVFGIKLNNSFYGNFTGRIKDETPNAYGHAMLAVGYDTKKQAIIVKNSWGRSWGDRGYCYIPESYFIANAYDCWTIKEIQ